MNKKTGQVIVLLSLLALVALPQLASAYNAPSLWPTGYWGPLLSCTGNYIQGGTNYIPNSGTCQSLCDLIGTFLNIIYFAISICFFILAPLFFGIGGVMIMLGGANPEMLSQGKRVITGAAIGVALVLCSYLLVFTFVGVFNAVVNGQSVFGTTISCTAQ